ncbi:hypothetical protein CJ030_MR7G017738 [Morella rubra]|uniref:Uncharacterized protein n=1 Tax=Morella rubra TaxID=262757 RepID=A0A6A1V4P9_9ROSI|nr:hypothetical protein CJ030_MR7G017738 [Morella rubra]
MLHCVDRGQLSASTRRVPDEAWRRPSYVARKPPTKKSKKPTKTTGQTNQRGGEERGKRKERKKGKGGQSRSSHPSRRRRWVQGSRESLERGVFGFGVLPTKRN